VINKNKEAIKILEENKLTNIHTPEDKIRMEIDKQVDHTKVDDRGPLDLTRKIEETDKRIKELDNSLSIALEINDRFQRESAAFTKRAQEAEGELTIIKGIGNTSPEMRALEKENANLKYDNKSLAKQVNDKVEEVKALKMKLELLDNKTRK
jgi:hypothetical protein